MDDLTTEPRLKGLDNINASELNPVKKRSALSKTVRAKQNSRAKLLKKFSDFDAENAFERLNMDIALETD